MADIEKGGVSIPSHDEGNPEDHAGEFVADPWDEGGDDDGGLDPGALPGESQD